jgi:predicted nuclease with RNAse H fold
VTGAGSERWAGVDVGGPRKGFHVALLSGRALLESPVRRATAAAVARHLERSAPRTIAVDCPCSYADPGAKARDCELELVRSGVCGIRFTPSENAVRSHPGGYYDWILNGEALYRELEARSETTGWTVIECFPTASFTLLGQPRGRASRARWSRSVLDRLDVAGLPSALNQDERDAVMAALTAQAFDRGSVRRFGEIVVAERDGTVTATA